MWILNFLPDFVIHLAALAGAAGLVFSILFGALIPTMYKLPVQLASAAILAVALFLEGASSNQAAWEQRVLEMEAKVAKAEAQSAEANTKIVTKVVTKVQIIKDTTNANQIVLRETVAKDLDTSCRLTNASVVLHNSASQNEVSGSTGNSAAGTSDVKASDLIGTVIDNYGTCYEIREKLKAWQEWYYTQKKIFEEVK